jgi:exodeoxyribonuclease VIII
MKPGLYPNIPRAQYENWDAARHSLLRLFKKTPLHALEEIRHPRKPSAEMEFGTALHMAVLEPKSFAREYAVVPGAKDEQGVWKRVDRRTTVGKNIWKEFEQENKGKIWLEREDLDAIKAMQRKAYEHPIAKTLLSGRGPTEVSAYWIDEETKAPCKARFDKVTDALPFDGFTGGPSIIDIKTSKSAWTKDFERDCAYFDYHQQGAFYIDGTRTISNIARNYVLIVFEKEPPFEVRVLQMEEAAIAQGRDEYRAHLRTYEKCRASGEWPGYPQRIEMIGLPSWAYRDHQGGE